MNLDGLLSGDDELAEAAVQLLIQSAEEPRLMAVEWLCSQLSVGRINPDSRWWVLRALAEVPGQKSRAFLVAGLKDDEPGVRHCAALGLRKNPDQQDIPFLILLLNDNDPICADLAADTLIQIGDVAVPDLLEVMQHGTQQARLRAERALALIGN